MAKELGGPRAARIGTADLAGRVERLELEAREFEARVRVIQGRAQLEKLRIEHPSISRRNKPT